MSDADSRPTPRYGEYATPEQQRAAVRAPETNPHYAPPESTVQPRSTSSPAAPQHDPVQVPAAEPSATNALRHPVDRVATVALLVLGLYNVITTATGRGNLATQIDQAYHSMGLTGDYAVTALTGTVADITAVVFLALWVAAAGLSSWRMLRGRIAFWIPLSAGILASIVSGVGYLILFLHDPTFLAYLQRA